MNVFWTVLQFWINQSVWMRTSKICLCLFLKKLFQKPNQLSKVKANFGTLWLKSISMIFLKHINYNSVNKLQSKSLKKYLKWFSCGISNRNNPAFSLFTHRFQIQSKIILGTFMPSTSWWEKQPKFWSVIRLKQTLWLNITRK